MEYLQTIVKYLSNNNNIDISKIYKYIIKNIDYKNNSWIINSIFNYTEPQKSILNLAYPSAIAYYYVTVIPSNSSYCIVGEFLDKHVFEISLTVYLENGDINKNYKPLSTYNYNEKFYNYNIKNNTRGLYYVIIRYYINLDIYTHDDIINNLPYVYDSTNNQPIIRISEKDREKYSVIFTKPYEKVITHISPVTDNNNFIEFYLPGSTDGLFADKNHIYLISTPGHHKLFQIKGHYKYSKSIPYIDFITVNQDNTKTDNGIPFYKFMKKDNEYNNIYIADNDIDDSYIYNLDKDALILRWNQCNTKRAIIFRMINYKDDDLIKNIGPLTPEQTKELMVNGFYPNIIPII